MTCAPPSRPTSGASDGSPGPSLHRLHGGGGRRRRRAPPRRRSAPARSTPTTRSSTGSAPRSTSTGSRTARRRSGRSRSRWCAGCSSARREPVLSLGGGAVGSARVRELLRRHTVVLLDVDVETAWHRGRQQAPAAGARPRAVRRACTRSATPVYEALADAVLLDSSREEVRRATPALRSIPARGAKLLWASAASGSYPVHVGEGLLASGFWPVAGRRFVITDEAVGALYRVPEATGDALDPSRRAAQDAGDRRAPAARAGGRRDGPRRPRGGARRRRGRRRRRLLRRGLPARGEGRAGADDARRAGRLRLRRQDRRRPPRGQELRRRLPPARRRAGRPGDDGDAAAGRAGGRLGRGDQDRPDRRRAAVGARARGRRARPRPRPRVRAHEARGGGERRAGCRGAARSSTSAIRSDTRSRPVTGYRRYRHGEAVGLGLLAALQLSGQAELRAEVAALLAARGLPTELDRSVDAEAVVAATARTRSAAAGGWASCWSRRRATCGRAGRWRTASCAAP